MAPGASEEERETGGEEEQEGEELTTGQEKEVSMEEEPESSPHGGGGASGQDDEADGEQGSPEEDRLRVTVQQVTPYQSRCKVQTKERARDAQCRRPGCV